MTLPAVRRPGGPDLGFFAEYILQLGAVLTN
jgi:hypothetical protein